MNTPLEQEVDQQEGFRAAPYKDTRGLWTVATGRCLETAPLTGAEWKYLLDNGLIAVTITQAGADWMEESVLDAVRTKLAAVFSWWPLLGPARQDALIDMAYQMGVPALLAFKGMIRAITLATAGQGPWQDVFDNGADSPWYKSETPARAKTVLTQLRDNVYPPGVSQ